MVKRAIIRLGDPTSHGGTVLEAFPTLNIHGKNASGIGHRGYCPSCKRDFVIVAGAANFTYFGQNIALEGMQTSCGAVLIATQHQATVDDTSGENTSKTNASKATTAKPVAAKELFNDKFQLRDEDGHPLNNAEYTITRPNGIKESGRTDESGYTHMIDDHEAAEIVAIHIGGFDD